MALTKVKAGNILLTTPGASSNDVTPATTQYVTTAIGNLIDTAPSTLNTLNELAAALGDDVNFSTTVTNSIATKLPLAGGTLTGVLTGTEFNVGVNYAGRFNAKQAGADAYGIVLEASANDAWLRMGHTGTYAQIDATYNASAGHTPLQLLAGGSARIHIATDGNVGIGTTPATHYTGYEALDIGNTLSLMSNNTSTNISTLTNNGYLNSNASNWVRKVADESTMYEQVSGQHRFKTAASGSAGGAITWSEKMRIDASGNVGIGTPLPGATLHVDPATNVTTSLGSPLIKVGGDNSWAGNGSLYSIGFGYLDTSISNKSPSEIGFKTTTNAGYTKGDLVFATRDVTTNTAPTERMRIDSTGDVLIGSSANLNVLSGTPKLQIGSGTGHASLQFYSGATSVNGIYFGDTSNASNDRYDGYIEYRHNSRSMTFRAGAAARLNITGSRVEVEDNFSIKGSSTAFTNFKTIPMKNPHSDFGYNVWGNYYVGARQTSGRIMVGSVNASAAYVYLAYIHYSFGGNNSDAIYVEELLGAGKLDWQLTSANTSTPTIQVRDTYNYGTQIIGHLVQVSIS